MSFHGTDAIAPGRQGIRRLCVLLLPLLCLLALPGPEPRAADLPPAVTPPAGWREEKDLTQVERALENTPVVPRSSCRYYLRSDDLFCLMVCPGVPATVFSRRPEGYRQLGRGLVRDDEPQAFELLAPAARGGDGAQLVLAGSPRAVWRCSEAAPMLAAYAKHFDIPAELTVKPVDPSRYVGKFASPASGQKDEYGWSTYARPLARDGRSMIVLRLIPYGEGWMPRKDFIAHVWYVFLNQWGQLTEEGRHWKVGPVHRLAFSRDGKAACLLTLMTGHHDAGSEKALKQAMRDLPGFVW